MFSTLIKNFKCAKQHSTYVSLRIWYQNGELRFFLTNSPPKNNLEATKSNVPASTPSSQHSTMPARKRKCPPSVSPPPEIARNDMFDDSNGNGDISTLAVERDPEPSELSSDLSINPHEEEITVNVDCRNSFQALADLDGDEQEDDSCSVHDADNDDCNPFEEVIPPKEKINRLCLNCYEVRVPKPWNLQCRECWLKD